MSNGKLMERLHLARASMDAIEKGGKAPAQMGGFAFQAWEDVLPAVRAKLIEFGVVFKPEIVSHTVTPYERQDKKINYQHVVHMRFTFVADDDREDREEHSWYGESLDTGDKGLQKAATSATKYFLLKFFMIPDKDTDTDAHETKPSAKPAPTWEETEAKSYLDSLKLSKEQCTQVTAAAKAKGIKGLDAYLGAKRAGCTNFAEVMNFLADGVKPGDAA